MLFKIVAQGRSCEIKFEISVDVLEESIGTSPMSGHSNTSVITNCSANFNDAVFFRRLLAQLLWSTKLTSIFPNA